MSGSTWRSRESKIHETEANLAIFPLCTAPFSLCVVLLWGLFWGPLRCPKCAQVDFLEILSCLLSNPTIISEFGAHLPLQIFILPRLLRMCQKRGREAICLGVFDLLETQILPKFLVRAPVVMIFHAESKNVNHSSFGALDF